MVARLPRNPGRRENPRAYPVRVSADELLCSLRPQPLRALVRLLVELLTASKPPQTNYRVSVQVPGTGTQYPVRVYRYLYCDRRPVFQ